MSPAVRPRRLRRFAGSRPNKCLPSKPSWQRSSCPREEGATSRRRTTSCRAPTSSSSRGRATAGAVRRAQCPRRPTSRSACSEVITRPQGFSPPSRWTRGRPSMRYHVLHCIRPRSFRRRSRTSCSILRPHDDRPRGARAARKARRHERTASSGTRSENFMSAHTSVSRPGKGASAGRKPPARRNGASTAPPGWPLETKKEAQAKGSPRWSPRSATPTSGSRMLTVKIEADDPFGKTRTIWRCGCGTKVSKLGNHRPRPNGG